MIGCDTFLAFYFTLENNFVYRLHYENMSVQYAAISKSGKNDNF